MSDNLIHLLPDRIANQIAAGEVIQRPASVIKELVENAVDAGATRIDIEVKDAGKTLLKVSDNGKGMAPMDARMAFERHATSKIRTAEDLFALTTMGFRGEALASIAAVAQVTLRTRTEDSEIGTYLEINGSKVERSEPSVCAVGASFSVKNLFFNVPARRKFLKSDDTELRHITSEIQRIAAVHPEIAFSLEHNRSLTLKLEPTTLKQRIIDLFGGRLLNALLPVESKTPLVHIHGFVSRADSCRRRGALQYFFVNDRYMRHPYFHRTVMNAYENLVPPTEQPEYFLFLHVDPGTIDVNIHPTKTEIKFETETEIGTLLYSIVRESLMKGASVPSIDFDLENVVDIPIYSQVKTEDLSELPITSSPISLKEDGHRGIFPEEFQPSASDYEAGGWKSFSQEFEYEITHPSSLSSTAKGERKTATEGCFAQTIPSSLRFDTPSSEPILLEGEYAVTVREGEIHLVHILRAQMKVIYEEYRQMIQTHCVMPNRLLFPELIELGVEDETLLQKYLEVLTQIGFDISYMGTHTYAINAIPMGFAAGDEGDLLLQLLAECDEGAKDSEEIILQRSLLCMTYRRLSREGQIRSREKISSLLQSLYQLSDHTHTPDGKLIVSRLQKQELRKRFN